MVHGRQVVRRFGGEVRALVQSELVRKVGVIGGSGLSVRVCGGGVDCEIIDDLIFVVRICITDDD